MRCPARSIFLSARAPRAPPRPGTPRAAEKARPARLLSTQSDRSASASVLPPEIDDVLQRPAARERGIIGEEMRNDILRHERPADMRGDRDARIFPERMSGRKRLRCKDIQG